MTEGMERKFAQQQLLNGYQLVDGVAMHAENGEHFQIPPAVIKRHIGPAQYVELRVDSPRFSVHDGASEQCACPSCNGAMTKPVLRHTHPASLVPLPRQTVPSRGWGEDFWVRITERSGDLLEGIVDNPLVESRLHGLNLGDRLFFREDHILAVHAIHRQEIVAGMNSDELRLLAAFLRQVDRSKTDSKNREDDS